MDELEMLFTEENDAMAGQEAFNTTASAAPVQNPTMTSQQTKQWCSSCHILAKEMEEKYSRNFIALKQKIFFTDNLIRVYQECKRQLQEAENQLKAMTEKYHISCTEKTLVQAQLKLILSNQEPSLNENTKLQEKITSLEAENEHLKVQLHAMDESRRMHEETLKVLKSQESGNVFELKKNHQKRVTQLKEEVAEKISANKKLLKKNKQLEMKLKKLQEKRQRRSSRSDFSHDELDKSHETSMKANMTEAIQKLNEAKHKRLSGNEALQELKNKTEEDVTSHDAPGGESVEIHSPPSQDPSSEHKFVQPTKSVPEKVAYITSTTSDESGSEALISPTKSGKKFQIPTSVNSAQTKVESSLLSPTRIKSMNNRMMDIKRKRALQAFKRRPTDEQQMGLTDLIERIGEIFSKSNLDKEEAKKIVSDELSSFCTKFYLDNHQDMVLNKILKFHKKNFSPTHCAWLDSMTSQSDGHVREMSVALSQNESSQRDVSNVEDVNKADCNNISNTEPQGSPFTPLTPQEFVSQMPNLGVVADDSLVGNNDISTNRTPESLGERNKEGKEPETEGNMTVTSEISVPLPKPDLPNIENDSIKDIPDIHIGKRKRKASSSADEEKSEKQPKKKLQAPKTFTSTTRRCTRSMSADTHSENPDLSHTPLRRSRRISERDETSSSSSESIRPRRSRRNSSNEKKGKAKKMKTMVSNARKTSKDVDEVELALPSIVLPEKPDLENKDNEKEAETKTSSEVMETEPERPELNKSPELEKSEDLKMESDDGKPVASISHVLPKSDFFVSSDEDSSDSEEATTSNRMELSPYDVTLICREMTMPLIPISPFSMRVESTTAGDLNKENGTVAEDNSVENKEDTSKHAVERSEAEYSIIVSNDEESKGRESISPSTDLCTAISFCSSKAKDLTKESVKKPLFQSTNEDTNTGTKDLNLDEDLTVTSSSSSNESFASVSDNFPVTSSIPTDILKPRRFSCEAPEMAVSVPPIKPMMKSVSMDQAPSPLSLPNRDLRKTASLPPHRKQGDVPSHWHSSVLSQVALETPDSSTDPCTSTLNKSIVLPSTEPSQEEEPEKQHFEEPEVTEDTIQLSPEDKNKDEALNERKAQLDLNMNDVGSKIEPDSTSMTPAYEFDPEELIGDMTAFPALSPVVTAQDSDSSCHLHTEDEKDQIEDEELEEQEPVEEEVANDKSTQDVESEKETGVREHNVTLESSIAVESMEEGSDNVLTGNDDLAASDEEKAEGEMDSNVEKDIPLKEPIMEEMKEDTPMETDENPPATKISKREEATQPSTSQTDEPPASKILKIEEAVQSGSSQTDEPATAVKNNATTLAVSSDAASLSEKESLVIDISEIDPVEAEEVKNPDKEGESEDSSNESDTGEIERVNCLNSFNDIDGVISTFLTEKSVNANIGDDFVLNCLLSLLEPAASFNLVNVIKKDPEKDITISTLPTNEQRFISKLIALHKTGICSKRLIPDKVLPMMFKVLQHFGRSFPLLYTHKLRSPEVDECQKMERVLRPVLVSASKPRKRELPKEATLSIVRVFAFLCRASHSSEAFLDYCRYSVVPSRLNVAVSVIQSLMCWKEELVSDEVVWQTVCRAVRMQVNKSNCNPRMRDEAVQQIDLLDKHCQWNTGLSSFSTADAGWLRTVAQCVESIKSAKFSREFQNFLDAEKEGAAMVSPMYIFDPSTRKALSLLEILTREKNVEIVKVEVLDKTFWPLLNSWSQHLHNHGDTEEGKEVSNTCMVAVMEALCRILSTFMIRQKQMHKNQPAISNLQLHHRIICTLMDNLSKRYFASAPRLVRCAVGAFLVRTCFCNSEHVMNVLKLWLKATASKAITQAREKKHKHLDVLCALLEGDEKSLRNLCSWLDDKCKVPAHDSLVKLLWPG